MAIYPNKTFVMFCFWIKCVGSYSFKCIKVFLETKLTIQFYCQLKTSKIQKNWNRKLFSCFKKKYKIHFLLSQHGSEFVKRYLGKVLWKLSTDFPKV